jgi:hypothetical protein
METMNFGLYDGCNDFAFVTRESARSLISRRLEGVAKYTVDGYKPTETSETIYRRLGFTEAR